MFSLARLVNCMRGAFAPAVVACVWMTLSAWPALAEDTVYTAVLTDLYDAPAGGAKLASIPPGVPLAVLQEDGDALKVAVTGWSPQGGETYLFREIGQRIRRAVLTEQAQDLREIIDEKEDYYENTWQDVRLTGWVARTDVSGDIAGIWKDASSLFHQRCTRCHALHRPTEFKANQWPAILKIMTVRAGLSASDAALVTQFLQTHAKDQETAGDVIEATADADQADPTIPIITGDAALAKAGAAVFADNGCGACHGDNAKTPVLPAYPVLAGQQADYVFKQLQDFRSGARTNDEYNVMRDSLTDLSEADLKAVSYWLSTL